jgi:hypothetical protein
MIRIFLITLALLGASAHASVSVDQALADLDRAISAHEERANPEPVLEAAAVLEHTLDEQNVRTAGASLALGNAYFIAGDIGRAVLHYKRGIEIDPRSPELRDNLAHARSFVQPAPPRESALSLTNIALSWRGIIARRALFTIALAGFIAFGVIATLAIARVRIPRPRLLACSSLALALLAIAPLGFETWTSTATPQVVLVDQGARVMSGPDASAYDPVFEDTLGAGVEARVLDERDGWLHVELGSGDRCWIDAHRVGYVIPRTQS